MVDVTLQRTCNFCLRQQEAQVRNLAQLSLICMLNKAVQAYFNNLHALFTCFRIMSIEADCAGLRSPRRSLLMDGDSADDLPVQSLRVSSMSPPRTAGASFGRQV